MPTAQPRKAASAVDWIAQFGTRSTCRPNAAISLHGDQSDAAFQILDEPGDRSIVHQAGDGRTAVLFDGTLYNRRELQLALGQPLATDARLVADAYVRWGGDFIHHLNGVFALVV